MLELQLIIAGAFFCYGVFTLQRKDFLLEGLKTFWKKLPQKLHEPLFSCGICVTSIWGTVFILSQFFIKKFVAAEYIILAEIPFYIISMCGICAVVDRAVKFFEVGYGYSVKNIPKTPADFKVEPVTEEELADFKEWWYKKMLKGNGTREITNYPVDDINY